MGEVLRMPGYFVHPQALADAITKGELGVHAETYLAVLGATNKSSQGPSSLNEAILRYENASTSESKEEQLKQIAELIRNEAHRLAPILLKVSGNFLQGNGTKRFNTREEITAEVLATLVFHKERSVNTDQDSPIAIRMAGETKPPGALPPLEENGAPKEPTDLEETKVTPESFLTLVEKEYLRIRDRYLNISGELDSSVQSGYSKELTDVEQRLQFWQGQIENLGSQHGKEREHYAEDIVIGERILLDRILNLGANIFSEPLKEDVLSRVGLRTGIGIPIPLPRAPIERGLRGKILPALVNHDVGYGRALKLRPHQVMALNKVKGLLKMREAQLKENKELPEELLRGTIVMPVGGGKTRSMVAAFAAAIEEGAFKIGDKFIILNHTEQIHQQNLKVANLLGGYFHRMFGRKLKVTEYKADRKNLGGDVLVVSIPSINTKERREQFEIELRKSLGEQGQVVMAAVDEIHHLELSTGKSKESWREAIKTIRDVSPNFYRIGFTATPTGKEGPYILRIAEHVLMHSGVTPWTYLTKVEGVDLTQLKISATANDFQTRELVSVLLQHPERNERIFKALQLQNKGLKGEATLIFAADLKHAQMMAKGYVEYFGRHLAIVGEMRGRITEKELAGAIEHYRKGEIGGLVAIVSGETNEKVRQKVLEAVEKNEIEAVFNVDVWYEGADLYMFTHLIGARPTFSRFKKGQERGRLNRRGPNEVSAQGELLSDKPKIIFEVVDRYHSMDRSLMFYGDLMGVAGHTQAKSGELFDAMTGKVVSEIDREGRAVAHRNIEELIQEKEKPVRPSAEVLLQPLVAWVWNILETQYAGDVEAFASDLGLSVEAMQEVLQGKGWFNARWFLRRIATLLYQEDREALVDIYNEERGLKDERVTDADIAILRGALAVYEKREGNLGSQKMSVTIPNDSLKHLASGTMTDGVWRRVWRGLAIYFSGQEEFAKLHHHFFVREGWVETATTAQEKLLLTARESVALKFGSRLPADTGIEGVPWQSGGSPLTRWLNGEKINFGSQFSPQEFNNQIRALLVGSGGRSEEVNALIMDAVFERQGWKRKVDTAQEKLLLTARELVAIKYGGRLPQHKVAEEVPAQQAKSTLTRWLNGEKINFGSGFASHQEFYNQIRALLVGLGQWSEDVDILIVDAIFEQQGWKRKADTPQEKLLLTARELVALKFGGRLLRGDTVGIEGVPWQSGESPLTRWLNGEKINFGRGLASPQEFYNQIRALLVGLGKRSEEVNDLIVNAVFEQQGWKRKADTAQEKLLLTARESVALKFGSRLPADTGIEGVPWQSGRSSLSRWLNGEEVRSNDSLFSQIRALLIFCGTPPAEADRLIEEALK